MAERKTARQRAREELTREIKELALSQLVEEGAAQLSLRAIARELGMASSALYRYFPSRDHLLTALIMDAYSDLADVLTTADEQQARHAVRKRWIAVCEAMRSWGVENAQRFALIYGSPVPGYRAPHDTTAPAERVMTAVSSIVDDAWAEDQVDDHDRGGSRAARSVPLLDGKDIGLSPAIPRKLTSQLSNAGQLLGDQMPAPVVAAMIGSFAQVIGMINLELGGHFVGGFEPADTLFTHGVERLADGLGLT